MPETDTQAEVPAEGGLTVTITIAEKDDAPTSSDPSPDLTGPNTFTIDNGKKILTITIAE